MAVQSPASVGAYVVAKQRKQPPPGESKGRVPVGRQVGVRIPPDLLADLEVVERGMGLDLSSVIRMILTEHRHEYVERVRSREGKPD